MENNLNMSPEELEKMLEKAKRDAQAMLDKMTPEERARAQAQAQRTIEEDQAAMQKLIDDAARVAAGFPAEEQEKPKFCTHCGAQASGGKFCTYCGQPF